MTISFELGDGFFGGIGTVLSILKFLLKGFDFLDVLGLLGRVFLSSGFEGFKSVGNSLKIYFNILINIDI